MYIWDPFEEKYVNEKIKDGKAEYVCEEFRNEREAIKCLNEVNVEKDEFVSMHKSPKGVTVIIRDAYLPAGRRRPKTKKKVGDARFTMVTFKNIRELIKFLNSNEIEKEEILTTLQEKDYATLVCYTKKLNFC